LDACAIYSDGIISVGESPAWHSGASPRKKRWMVAMVFAQGWLGCADEWVVQRVREATGTREEAQPSQPCSAKNYDLGHSMRTAMRDRRK
jgi:hypothetical protein